MGTKDIAATHFTYQNILTASKIAKISLLPHKNSSNFELRQVLFLVQDLRSLLQTAATLRQWCGVRNLPNQSHPKPPRGVLWLPGVLHLSCSRSPLMVSQVASLHLHAIINLEEQSEGGSHSASASEARALRLANSPLPASLSNPPTRPDRRASHPCHSPYLLWTYACMYDVGE